MTTALLTKPRPTHREEKPVRECRKCGAYLRSFTPTDCCDPCSKGESTDKDVLEVLADSTPNERRQVFDALQRVWESMP